MRRGADYENSRSPTSGREKEKKPVGKPKKDAENGDVHKFINISFGRIQEEAPVNGGILKSMKLRFIICLYPLTDELIGAVYRIRCGELLCADEPIREPIFDPVKARWADLTDRAE